MASLLHRSGSFLGSGLLLLTAAVSTTQVARAEVLVRAQRHCIFKHKQAGGIDACVVNLDDGTDFTFRGPSPQALQVQTYRGGAQIGDSAFIYWEQPRTDNCVAVRTTDGRYQSITCSEKSNCR